VVVEVTVLIGDVDVVILVVVVLVDVEVCGVVVVVDVLLDVVVVVDAFAEHEHESVRLWLIQLATLAPDSNQQTLFVFFAW